MVIKLISNIIMPVESELRSFVFTQKILLFDQQQEPFVNYNFELYLC